MKVQGAKEIFENLQKAGISIRYMKGYLRITAGSREENRELVLTLDSVLS